ncbi:RAD50-interacting protein 1 [Pararge aegeria]|uniref:Jg10277 protein n=3 Tax=Pararge aegeria TaxID=116150 RepID=A0A8S4S2R3_9NEOP|nr:RAD50-interacting protein 1 [Pararge aegeria]CAH2246959.1 jg10277 [Pararge aegeria aegeria]
MNIFQIEQRKSKIKEEIKKEIIQSLNITIGSDIHNISSAYALEAELMRKKTLLISILSASSDEVPTKLPSAIKKAELNSTQINSIQTKRALLMKKVESFLSKTEPLTNELEKRFKAIGRLEEVVSYFKLYSRIEELSNEMKQCKDDEQLVALYGEMKEMCNKHQKTHQGAYIKEYKHYWHNVLKDNLTIHYEDVLKLIKWPLTSGPENSPLPKEVLNKFSNLTKNLFLVQEPSDVLVTSITGDFIQGQDPCLPVRVLLRPLKKRFAFHFTGPRQTARIDRPEWFLTQTLTWIKDHQEFVKNNVQPIAEKLQITGVNAVDEFNAGLIALAAERLHTVLAIYHTQGTKGEMGNVDAAFAHAVDETLGFHKELTAISGTEVNSVISVLTKAETFVHWLAVEKKYALAKMDETLGNEQWIEPVAAGVGAAVGSVVWVPRGADWFIALLKTIEDRYSMLPQPGHRLQFLELQLELIEEWRIRLTQLLNAATSTLKPESFLVPNPHPLIAIINAGHHTRTVLLQWAHSLHYLQLHYYRRQFQYFTHQQHTDDRNKRMEVDDTESSTTSLDSDDETTEDTTKHGYAEAEGEIDESISLNEVEESAKILALKEVNKRNSMVLNLSPLTIIPPIVNLAVAEPLAEEDTEEGGVFGDAPALQAHLRDSGIAALVEHIMLEFKATIREYKKQRWHSMLTMEQLALSVSTPLCGPLSSLCARLSCASSTLAPRLAVNLRSRLAAHVDDYIFEEVVLESWFNTGGTLQITYDVKRNLVPAFAPTNTYTSNKKPLPKLIEACKLLNLDYEVARHLSSLLAKQPKEAACTLSNSGITHIDPDQVARILNQRTDLSSAATHTSVMELF